MRRLFCIFATLSVSLAMFAQEHSGAVTLLEFDGKTALFAAEGISAKKGDMLRNAEENIFEMLFYTGVEGINNGHPLMNKPKEQLKTKDYAVNFFKKRMHAYLKQDASGKNVLSEPLGQAIAVSAGFSCVYLIPIKYNVLIRDLKTEGLLRLQFL